MFRQNTLLASIRFFLFLMTLSGFRPLLGAEEKLLIFGRVQDNPVRAVKDRQDFVDYLAKKLAPLGITGGKVLVVEKLSQLAHLVREDKVDLFHDSLVPTMVLSKWSGSIPILRQWKYEESDYYSVILVRKDSGINTLSDLKGKVIAFDEPHSTSAHVLPRMLLVENHLKLVPFVAPAKPDPNIVGFIHSSDDNAPHLIAVGKVDAAGTSHREFETLRPEIRDKLKIIARSRSVPRQIISLRKDLDPKIAKAIKETLLSMKDDPEGREAMRRQQQTTGIDELPPKSLEQLKDVEQFIFSSLGKQVDSW
jgi:phosphonate transport system substrate-binding protein